MPLPVKALRYGQLRKKTAGSAVPTSGHQVYKVEYTDTDGQTKTGFYKELIPDGTGDGSYPDILGRYSVAASILIRLALGERAAEDRLVLDDQGRIKGTVSVNLPNYKPLAVSGQTLPIDLQERELVCPSTETLLKYNAAELLVASWRCKCDDRHPGNFSLFGLIDWDMAFYPYTYIMKGKRLVDGILKDLPEKAMKLLSKDLDDFPNIEGRTHTPTNSVPGNINIAKRFQSYLEFQALATNQALKTETGDISWQEQFFSALLKELLVFEPDMLRVRLQEYFGEELKLDYDAVSKEIRTEWELKYSDLKLNLQELFGQSEKINLDYRYLSKEKRKQLKETYPDIFSYLEDHFKNEITLNHRSLTEEKWKQLEKTHPDFFNEDTNQQPFINHIMRVFQHEYDELYRAVVFYAGCTQNKSNVPVVGFSRFLRNKPSAFHKAKAWAAHENEKMKEHWDGYNSASHDALDAYTTPPEGRYDPQKMTQRYHQIWRDAHAPTIKAILDDAKTLVRQLGNDLRKNPLPLATKEEVDVNALTESFQLIGTPELLEESKTVDCDKASDLKKALEELETIAFELHTCAQKYYHVDRRELRPDHNQEFCTAVAQLIVKSETHVLPHLMASQRSDSFGKYLKNLKEFYNGIHFQLHLIEKDVALSQSATHDYSALLNRKHTDEEVISTCLKTLFTWVNTLEEGTFNSIILNSIEGYKPSYYNITSQRFRAPSVEAYLKSTKHNCANRLANILGEGGVESTSLNTHLLKNLIPMMITATEAQVEINLLSVRNAIERGNFQAEFYAKQAQEFVKQDEQFIIPISKNRIIKFNDAMFTWVHDQSRKNIEKLVAAALKEYAGWGLFGGTRVVQVKSFLDQFHNKPQTYSKEKLIAMILTDGGNEDNSLNTCLLKRILKGMKQDSSSKKTSALDVVLSDITEAHLPYYGTQIKLLAKPKTYEKASESKASVNVL
ncbi:hypothetical protein [Legionella hackeliae]|uniref:Uncharacterized protein n=1 Tax=Legionella hackeliae TaxID=449 RepID=A0A0A8UU14_LEGHA|nr:hypothetical protein [Legionella hackeliae]KTD12774.1 hypothetical protein Lhac_1645 [Legionella hackeliae]CEK12198.1 protein of unknown function [Legionella hackeliae]STX48983.1 Uncharacterised protein [Legionella hackeliae]